MCLFKTNKQNKAKTTQTSSNIPSRAGKKLSKNSKLGIVRPVLDLNCNLYCSVKNVK